MIRHVTLIFLSTVSVLFASQQSQKPVLTLGDLLKSMKEIQQERDVRLATNQDSRSRSINGENADQPKKINQSKK
jgi:hypothetical protein